MTDTDRVVVLVDMDCFYCQVEEKLDPTLEGKPIAVVQYNAWRGGGIIAVNYPARSRGVTRHMRGDDAKKICPEIMLARVPNVRGKADLTKYREAGQKVAEVLQTFTPLLERASVDEAYLDITNVVKKRIMENSEPLLTIDKIPNTYVVNYDTADFLHNLKIDSSFCHSNQQLAFGGMIVEEIRKEVFEKTGYQCSAGIAHNKILAKLVCGLNKPNKQTILPHESVPTLYKDLPIKKIKSLGGKFGNALAEELNISMMGELIKFSEKELIKKFDAKNGKWLYNIARGIDFDPVTTRLTSKSIGCCKRFPGNNCLRRPEQVEHWLNELAMEISERLEKDMQENKRKAKQMVVSFAQAVNETERSSSRTQTLNSYNQPRIAKDSMEIIKKYSKKVNDCYNITFLGISVGNFQEIENSKSISTFFKNMNETKKSKCTTETEKTIEKNDSPSTSKILDDSGNDKVDDEKQNSGYTEPDGFDKGDDVENLSIYSATTEELDEDPKEYIYYEDIFPESLCKKPVENSQIEGELKILQLGKTNETDICRPSSFFGKYFDSTTDESITSSSSIEVSENHEKNTIHGEHNFSLSDDIPFADEEKNKTHEDEKICIDKEICLDCNKQILVSEMAEHQDYHFALKLVRSEAHLYNPQMSHKSSDSAVSRNNKKSQIKKNNGNTQKGSISKFLQHTNDSSLIKNVYFQQEASKQSPQGIKRKTSDRKLVSLPNDIENPEFCQECNTNVEFEDKVSHDDYHLAKKLHAELNTTKLNRNQEKVSTELPKNKKPSDISMYFRRK
ncbi:unnamed protein product [Phaedon cochleariae]|uniref:DNA polymerase eta n=1 Tax=Phaedon cochleariae TaxID=80249 RepID=A0A9P0DUT3_PHACE|nr:unnamed protein product [Phaedon cochleariae]